MRVVTAAEMRAMDRNTIETFGIPGRVLMENAGRGATRSFLERIYRPQPGAVGILAGRGNNGGDGFVMARYLAQQGIAVQVFLLSTHDRVQGDAAANLELLPKLSVPVIEIPDPPSFAARRDTMHAIPLWIDAILGTGLNADVQGFFREVITFLNGLQRPVFAVDIPSGLNSDTGQPCGVAVRAAATATFGHAKIGHLIYPGLTYCGVVDVIDIGIPPSVADSTPARQALITGVQVRSLLPRRPADAHKGHTGHALVVAASTGKTGAAAMAATAAVRMGAGLVTLAVPRSLNPILEALTIEAMTLPLPDDGQGALSEAAFDDVARAWEGKRCVALGPGLGMAPPTGAAVQRILRTCPLPIVLDADGLNHLAEQISLLDERPAATVLTPHPGEMARLLRCTTAEVQNDRVAAARGLAQQHKVVVLLKGGRTLVAAPDGRVWINPTGNAGMASGGMGDVLTGAIAGLLAQGLGPLDAALAAVFLHGLAADILAARAPWGYLATEVMHALPQAIRRVLDDPPVPPLGTPLF
jgi:NAD(P)H-hydrate epimerase